MSHKDWLHYCFTIARDLQPTGKARLAACIVKRNRLVSIGVNCKKSHPMAAKYGSHEHKIYLHAEVNAIKNALRVLHNLQGCTLYVARAKYVNGYMTYGLAKPCIGCASCIVEFGVKDVIWSE